MCSPARLGKRLFSLEAVFSLNKGFVSPTGAAVLAAAPWALGFAAVATVVVLVAAVLRWRKVPITHEVNALQ